MAGDKIDPLLIACVLEVVRSEYGRLPYDLDEANRQFAARIIRVITRDPVASSSAS